MQKKEFKKHLLIATFLVAFLIISLFVSHTTHYQKSIIVYDDTKITTSSEPKAEIIYAKKTIKELREHYGNDDVVGKLTIKDTGIDTPIMQSSNNDYYLNHNEYGSYQAEGSIYEDYRTSLDGKKVLIFGHSSPNWRVPFNELEKYYDKSFYDTHKYITVTSEEDVYQYEIFSVYIETSDFSYMNLNIDDDTYNKYLQKYKDNSLYDTGVKIAVNDEIIILQTCSNHSKYSSYKKKYLLVIGKKINKEEKNEKGTN